MLRVHKYRVELTNGGRLRGASELKQHDIVPDERVLSRLIANLRSIHKERPGDVIELVESPNASI